jgi:hypothetical protein
VAQKTESGVHQISAFRFSLFCCRFAFELLDARAGDNGVVVAADEGNAAVSFANC